ncbi:hypothetical protein [Telmatospirillum sp. J64-1]|uniref:hypothetical protein n=1 Tax=Telmatospirillum sp. J64-1 TaxID=2502183 RepID=UPI00115CB9FD|nr:hypothetical protein [Telmatospirillum sp. J64-1]
MEDVKILCFSSSATATEDSPGNVLISGSYGGEYNAYHAAKWGIRGVILNDAGVGRNNAGITGLKYLDQIGLAAATADAQTCHIGDAEHMLEHGVISFVNQVAEGLGIKPGQTVREGAERMRSAPVCTQTPPPISGGKRYTMIDEPGKPKVICVDAAPMLEDSDAGAIAITGSHAALFRGKPDGLIAPALHAVFFNDAGVGLGQAGIKRLALLDERKLIAGTVSADSAAIGNSREIYEIGILSHVNEAARAAGGQPGMALKDFVALLRSNFR